MARWSLNVNLQLPSQAAKLLQEAQHEARTHYYYYFKTPYFGVLFFHAFTSLRVKGQPGLKTHIRIVRLWAKVDTERLVVSFLIKRGRGVRKLQLAGSCQLLNACSKQTGFAPQRAKIARTRPTPEPGPRQKLLGPAPE